MLADSIAPLVWMAGPDGSVSSFNRSWYAYAGTTPAQMEGWGWQSVHDPASLPQVLERWRASLATGEPAEMVFPLRGADGVFRPFLTRMVPVRDAAGHVIRWFGTSTDITLQRQAEEAQRRINDLLEERVAERTRALRESEERFRLLVEGITDYAIFMLDPDGRVSNWNAGARAHQGLSRDEILGQHFSRLLYRGGSRERGPQHGLWRRRRAGGQLRDRGLARAQGRQPLLGQRGYRRDPQRCWRADRFCQDHARHHRAEERRSELDQLASALAVAEDGGDGPTDRRRRARFQQSADRHLRQSRHNRATASQPTWSASAVRWTCRAMQPTARRA